MVHVIPFGKLQKLWAAGWGDAYFLFYSQRSHLARIKGRVNKGMMPFSWSSMQIVSPWLTLRYRLMLFKKPKLFCKTQHQTKPKHQHNKLRHNLRHQLRLMKFLWRFLNFFFFLFFATCFVPVFECLVCFGSTFLFCFVRLAFTFATFDVGFAGHSLIFTCLWFALLWTFRSYVGFAGYVSVCPASNVCPIFMWALRAIL